MYISKVLQSPTSIENTGTERSYTNIRLKNANMHQRNERELHMLPDQKNTILIVDDEPLNISALSHILKAEYTLYIEKDGNGCIEAAKALNPDLILLDIVMPGMSGFDVIKVLKEDETTRNIPVIFVTGLNNSRDEAVSFTLGASDYINKPFSAPVVKLRVKNQIQIVNQMRSIKSLSIPDTVTDISNKLHFTAILTQEWQSALRNNSHLGLMVIDINDFAALNTQYGQTDGDLILRNVAQFIATTLIDTGYHVARWGNDEFIITLPYANIDSVLAVAEKMHNLINSQTFVIDNNQISLTVSIGINAVNLSKATSYTLETFVSSTIDALSNTDSSAQSKIAIAKNCNDSNYVGGE